MNLILQLFISLILNNLNTSIYGIISRNANNSSKDSAVSIFSVKNSSFRSSVHSQSIKNYTLMQLDTQRFQSMRSKNFQKMNFTLPYKKENIEINLETMQLFDQDFKVITDKSYGKAVQYQPGIYYTGKIAGDAKSLVTLTVFEREIHGIISSSDFGNLNLGKSNPQDPTEYILYGQDEAMNPVLFDCRTADSPLLPPDLDVLKPQIEKQLESRATGCVAIDFELTYEVYTYFQNSLTNSANWITTLFSAVKSMYQAESIDISIKTINVWTSEDGYADDVGAALTTLVSRRVSDPAYTGNLVHLVRGRTCTGGCSLAGIAYLNALCKPNIRFGVSEPIFTYDAYPAYSWSVDVLTHELGHNLGSNHTHWCGWTGGPIDNCAAAEGTCSPGPTPSSGGGTIMSYCHQQGKPGVSFANGFGPQPGNFIRSIYNAATCLSTSCGGTGSTPTCTDGIQNGSETGIDCGGSCSPCNSSCPSPVNLSQGKTATQSSTYNASYPASKSNDGLTNNFNHTNSELQPWWQVDLAGNYQVTSIQITNRGDCCGNRIKKFRIFVSPTPVGSYAANGSIYEYNNPSGMTNGQVLTIANLTAVGQYVKIWVDNSSFGANYIHLAEIKVMGCTSSVNPCETNQEPTITISTSSAAIPQGSSTYPQGSSFAINASVNDPDGTVNSVEFYEGVNLLGTDNSSPFSYILTNASSDSYVFTAKAIDNCNKSTLSSPITITTTSNCNDGFKNGTETGVDCGGNCTACPQGCVTSINLSQGKTASQSSTYNASYPASKANDGASSINHTNAELQPWWQVDLGGNYLVTSIQLTNRQDCCGNRIKRFRVFVSNAPIASYTTGDYIYVFDNPTGLSMGQVLNINNLNSSGRYVRVWVDNTGYGNNYLHLSEVKVMGCNSSANPCTGNQFPSVSIATSSASLPQGASSYPRGSSFNVQANVLDGDGVVSLVEFYNGSTMLGSDDSSPFIYTISPANATSYTLIVKAIDNCNAVTTSNQLEITTTTSCSDGFQNGTETGVDCGGSCTACPQQCTSSVNISQGKASSQSSNYGTTYPASKANDGNNTNFNHTNSELQPWWQVDLGGNFLVNSIEIRNRTDCCGNRIKRMRVFISSTPVSNYSTSGFVYEFNNATGLANAQIINVPNLTKTGRYVRIWVDNTGYGNNALHLAEVRVMGCSFTAGSSADFTNGNIQDSSNQKKIDIRLFPNPVRDIVQFNYSYEPDESVMATLYDVNGRQLLQTPIKEKQLDLSFLENGSYFIHLNYKGEHLVRKVIKF